MSLDPEKFLVTDEDLEALDRFNKLTLASKVRLVVYLKAHELDIDQQVNDFGDLKSVFIQLFNRHPNV